jgi:cbb3-type cytochrome oxidase subunit 3
MFSFIKKYAESLSGVSAYGDIGLVLFLIVFLGAVVVAFTARKEFMAEQANLPLNDSKPSNTQI